MVKVVAPLRIHAKPALTWLKQNARVVEIALGDDVHVPTGAVAYVISNLLDRGEHVQLTRVEDGMGGIEAQAIEVKVLQPGAGVIDNEFTHRRAPRPVKIKRPTPCRLVAIGEIRAEFI